MSEKCVRGDGCLCPDCQRILTEELKQSKESEVEGNRKMAELRRIPR